MWCTLRKRWTSINRTMCTNKHSSHQMSLGSSCLRQLMESKMPHGTVVLWYTWVYCEKMDGGKIRVMYVTTIFSTNTYLRLHYYIVPHGVCWQQALQSGFATLGVKLRVLGRLKVKIVMYVTSDVRYGEHRGAHDAFPYFLPGLLLTHMPLGRVHLLCEMI